MNDNSWYKKGELPPVGEIVEGYVQDSSRQWKWLEVEVLKQSEPKYKECAVYVVKHGILRWCDQFRPIQSEREKAIDAACEIVDKECAKANINIDCSYAQRCVIDALVDAGWRPSND